MLLCVQLAEVRKRSEKQIQNEHSGKVMAVVVAAAAVACGIQAVVTPNHTCRVSQVKRVEGQQGKQAGVLFLF